MNVTRMITRPTVPSTSRSDPKLTGRLRRPVFSPVTTTGTGFSAGLGSSSFAISSETSLAVPWSFSSAPFFPIARRSAILCLMLSRYFGMSCARLETWRAIPHPMPPRRAIARPTTMITETTLPRPRRRPAFTAGVSMKVSKIESATGIRTALPQ